MGTEPLAKRAKEKKLLDFIDLPFSFKETLLMIACRLREKTVEWYLRGSTSLLLQGFSLPVGDIDIETDAENGPRVHHCLEKYSVIPYGPSVCGLFNDYYGRYMIDTVRIDLLHDIRINRPPYSYHSEMNEIIKRASSSMIIADVTIRTLPVEEDICLKLARGQLEKCQRILEQPIFTQLVDLDFLKSRIASTGLDLEGADLLTRHTAFDWRALL
jgi:hypothetical protein